MRKIIIPDATQSKIEDLLEYLEIKWSDRIRKKFANKLYQAVKIIQNNPEAFPQSEAIRKYINVSLQNNQHCFISSIPRELK